MQTKMCFVDIYFYLKHDGNCAMKLKVLKLKFLIKIF